MTVRSVEDQVAALLARDLVERRSGGVPTSGLEASAVFDSIALNLLLKPRTALYFEFMARNGLTAAVRAELASLAMLRQDIVDCGNPYYKIDQTASLVRARSALLQLEGLPRIDSSQAALQAFDRSIQEFLEKGLAKNIRRVGASDMMRPAAEALQDLPSTMGILKAQHEETLSRLYALAVGMENFSTAPFAALLGTSIVSRARADLEGILGTVEADGDPSAARDYAVRLLASRAAIQTIASPPALLASLFNSSGTASGSALTLSENVDLRDLMQVGDLVRLAANTRRVVEVEAGTALLDSAVSYSGQVIGESALVVSHQAFHPELKAFLSLWGSTKFPRDLISLDVAVAPLLASQSPAQRVEALAVVDDLETALTMLLNLLMDPSTMLPTGAAAEERQVVEGILATLTERHYDRAVDLLLRGDLQSLLEMDQDSASYAGSFLKASSVYAQAGGVASQVDEEAPTAISSRGR